MLSNKSDSALESGQSNLSTESAPSVKGGAEKRLEEQLERILAHVPPLIPLPGPKTRCPFTGLARTSLVELVAPCQRNSNRPPVKAIYKKAHKFATRGRWLIPSENLFRHLLSLAETSSETYLTLSEERKGKHASQ